MEFYSPTIQEGSFTTTVSIPNGMEFYKFRSHRNLPQNYVSIPNGMEFYHRIFWKHRGRKLFQFPTGWNSTDPHRMPLTRQTSVSIPNGMEFYSPVWNSPSVSSSVSIPNGMEFYNKRYEIYARLKEFQFPTGWNSTFSSFS